MPDREEVTLMVAAHTLGMSYERARRQVLVGALEGRQDEDRRWVVTRASVDRMLRDRAEPVAQPA